VSSVFNILFAVAEASPLVKVGGLGDVAGSLPRALRRLGQDVRIIMPHYAAINLEGYQVTPRGSFDIPFLEGQEGIGVSEVLLKDETPVYLLENEKYLGRNAVYGEPDDLDRFLLFSRAVMEATKRLGWSPHILHCHDWHTAMVPALLRVSYKDDPFYASCASIYTIHNLGYQGWFDDWFASRAGLHDFMPPADDPLRHRSYSMMAIGIYNSDVVSTVSETYAREILTPEYGMGLEALLERRKDSLVGIRNGIDYEEFDPARDQIIAANYDESSLEGRVANKLALQQKAGLPVSRDIPLLGITERLVYQKGIDILIGALHSLLGDTEVQIVLQGTGEFQYEEALRNLQNRFPDKARIYLVLDFSLARQIFAGSDIFLSPSRYEPCGLSHIIAMHYGAVPVVRRTGGLAETVTDSPPDLSSGLGFVFERYDQNDLLAALRRALAAFRMKDAWLNLMKWVMQVDFSWGSSVPRYVELYEMARRRATNRAAR
jgi:starch synthase